jgi:heme exporter protein C
MTPMQSRVQTAWLGAAVVLFAAAPLLIASAPNEATMGLVAKIFYFHVPAWFVMFAAVFVSGIASAVYLFTERPSADRLAVSSAELAVLFGLMGLTTGPLWGRVSWGVWWQWDVRLTTALILELTFIAYLLLRRYGGPGSEKLSAGLALFGMANVPFVYVSVNFWRTIHPENTVVPTLEMPMAGPFWWCVASYFALFLVMLGGRRRLEEQRAAVDRLQLAYDDD